MNASDGTGLVTINDAVRPGASVPSSVPSSIAAAPFIVQAASASVGVRRILMHPSAHTMRMSPDGDEPGL